MSYTISVSNGEILDKLSILYIKKKYCQNETQSINIITEISLLAPLLDKICNNDTVTALYNQLCETNTILWTIEDNIRKKEQLQHFDSEFITLARNVYFFNDKRAELKKQINIASQSSLIEEKIYTTKL